MPQHGQRGAVIAWGILASVSVLIGGLSWHARLREQQLRAERDQPVKGPQFWGGVALGDDILLFDVDGNLALLRRADWRPRSLPIHGVFDVKAPDRRSAFILSASPLPNTMAHDGKIPPGTFTVSRYHFGQFERLPPVAYSEDDRPWALALRHGDPLVISDHAVQMFDPSGNTWRHLALSVRDQPRLPRGDRVVAVSNDGRTLFVGFNRGEWGGGLVAIDLASRSLTPVEARHSTDLCAGPLNGECDPVTGVVPDPDHQQCVLASVGLSHMMMHGRIIRACPGRVDVVFEHTLEGPSGRTMRQILGLARPPLREPSQTEAFFALVDGEQGSIWAVSPFALYRREPNGWSRHPMPDMTRHGDIGTAEGLSGIMILPVGAMPDFL